MVCSATFAIWWGFFSPFPLPTFGYIRLVILLRLCSLASFVFVLLLFLFILTTVFISSLIAPHSLCALRLASHCSCCRQQPNATNNVTQVGTRDEATTRAEAEQSRRWRWLNASTLSSALAPQRSFELALSLSLSPLYSFPRLALLPLPGSLSAPLFLTVYISRSLSSPRSLLPFSLLL